MLASWNWAVAVLRSEVSKLESKVSAQNVLLLVSQSNCSFFALFLQSFATLTTERRRGAKAHRVAERKATSKRIWEQQFAVSSGSTLVLFKTMGCLFHCCPSSGFKKKTWMLRPTCALHTRVLASLLAFASIFVANCHPYFRLNLRILFCFLKFSIQCTLHDALLRLRARYSLSARRGRALQATNGALPEMKWTLPLAFYHFLNFREWSHKLVRSVIK